MLLSCWFASDNLIASFHVFSSNTTRKYQCPLVISSKSV
jgi:hypothetical protein